MTGRKVQGKYVGSQQVTGITVTQAGDNDTSVILAEVQHAPLSPGFSITGLVPGKYRIIFQINFGFRTKIVEISNADVMDMVVTDDDR